MEVGLIRAIVLALFVSACGPTTEITPRTLLAYPEEALPAEVLRLPRNWRGDDLEGFRVQEAASEAAMAEMRRHYLPIIVRVINLPEDGPAWTVIGFRGAMPDDFTGGRFEGRWIAERVRYAWNGHTVTDWIDSDKCNGMVQQLGRVRSLDPPNIAEPNLDSTKSGLAKLSIELDREFTLWTTWAGNGDLRFGDHSGSELGQWATRLAITLHECWTTNEPA